MIDWDKIDNLTAYELNERVVDTGEFVQYKIARLKLGLYDEERDGDLLTVLEEIERILR